MNCRPWQRIATSTACSALLAAMLLGAGVAQATMYRWVDGNGRVQYGDTLPATYQQSGAAEINKQGQVVKHTQSEAERKAEAARAAEDQRARAAQQKQAQLDRALTATYTTEAEIDLARDRALEHHKLAIQGAKIRSKAVDANLADVSSRIATIEKAGRKAGPGLQDQLAQANREAQDLKRTIQSNEAAMSKVRDKYAVDKARFRELMATQ